MSKKLYPLNDDIKNKIYLLDTHLFSSLQSFTSVIMRKRVLMKSLTKKVRRYKQGIISEGNTVYQFLPVIGAPFGVGLLFFFGPGFALPIIEYQT